MASKEERLLEGQTEIRQDKVEVHGKRLSSEDMHVMLAYGSKVGAQVHNQAASDTITHSHQGQDIQKAEKMDSIYCSIDPDAASLETARYASVTKHQQALNQMTNVFIRPGIYSASSPGLFEQLKLNRTIFSGSACCGPVSDAGNPDITMEENILSINKDAEARSLTVNHSVDFDAVVSRQRTLSSSSSTASSRRSNFRKSTELWQEEDIDDYADGIFSTTEPRTNVQYMKQTSETGSLPDVILSNSTLERPVSSPDLLLLDPFLSSEHESVPSEMTSIPGISRQMAEIYSSNSPSSAKSKKLEMEGMVYDPKMTFRRQVSFNEQISVYGHCRADQRNTAEALREITTKSNKDDAIQADRGSERINSSSAEEKRLNYSHKTSGYGTGESSKNSTHVSSTEDQMEVNEVFESYSDQKFDQNQPNLSIFNGSTTLSGTVLSDWSDHTHNETVMSAQISINMPKKAGMLPNLSIFGSHHESSFMVSTTDMTGSEDLEDDKETKIPPELEVCLTPPVSSIESNRTSASDNYALKALEQYQRSPPSSTQSYQSQISTEKSRHSSQTSSHRGQTHRAHLQKIREDLISNHIEDMLFRLNHIQSDKAEFENVILRIKQVLASESISPSPITPLTPQIKQGTSPNEKVLGPKANYQHSRSFSFEAPQTFELRSKQKETQNCLVLSSRCDYCICPYPRCKRGKELWKGLETSLLTRPSLMTYIDYTEVLTCLFDHSQQCDEFKCPVPWCTFLTWTYCNQSYEDVDLKEVTKKLTELAQFPTMKFTCTSNNEETFYPLNSQFSSRPLVEGTDWMALIRMGQFGSSVLAVENQSLNTWVIKRVQLTDPEDDNRLEVYRQLKGHNSAHIVTHLWMNQSVKVLLVCSVFEPGGTLHEVLQNNGPLNSDEALDLFLQILSAAAYLHDKKVLFLYWKAKNVVLDKKRVAKLCNFSTAVYYEGSYDLEKLLWLIPATLLCPELLKSDIWLCPEVDTWGLGCLLAELVTGMSSRQDLIHHDRIHIEKQIRESPLPTIVPGNSKVQEILRKCWEINPRDRLPAAQLMDILPSCRQQVT